MKGRNNKRRAARKLQATAPPKVAVIVCAVCGQGDGKYKCPKCRAPFCCVQCSKDHKATACPATTTTDASSLDSTPLVLVEPSKYLSSTTTATTKDQHPHKRARRRSKSNNDDDDSHDDEPGWNITSEMKARIQQSSWLRKELQQDGGLRQLIDNIDAASDMEEEEDDDDNKDGKSETHCRQGKSPRNQRTRSNPNTANISARELALARTKHTHPKFASFTDQLLLLAGVLQPSGDGNGAEDGSGVTRSDGGTVAISGDGMIEGNGIHAGHLVLAPIPTLNSRAIMKSSTSGTDDDEEEDGDDDEESENSVEDSEDSSSSSSSEEDGDESDEIADD